MLILALLYLRERSRNTLEVAALAKWSTWDTCHCNLTGSSKIPSSQTLCSSLLTFSKCAMCFFRLWFETWSIPHTQHEALPNCSLLHPFNCNQQTCSKTCRFSIQFNIFLGIHKRTLSFEEDARFFFNIVFLFLKS